MSFDSIIFALSNFDEHADQIVLDTAQKFTPEIIDMNVSQQFYGKLANSAPIQPDYTGFTVRIKQSIGQPTDRVTLRDTEAFHRSFKVTFNRSNKEFTIWATDYKTGRLVEKYTEQIFGLTDENLDNLIQMIAPGVEREFKRYFK